MVLKSSQGAVSVEGTVSAYGEVSLASANDLTVKAVTSKDGGVALFSATGVINNSGLISGVEDINLASAQDLTVNQRIRTELGTISVVSTEGSVKVNSVLNSGFNTYVAAKRNVATLGIRSLGDVALESDFGRVSVNGNVRTSGGDVYISGLTQVKTRDIISLGGDVSVISNASAIITGYIRTDSADREGNVDLNALTNIKVAGVVDIDGSEHSIYAGDEGVITIAHQQLRRRSNDDFVIGNIGRSGTLALASSSPIISLVIPPPPVVPVVTTVPAIAGALAIFAVILNAGETAPAHQSEINPLTGQPYGDETEFDYVQRFTISQRNTLKKYLKKPEYQLEFDDVKRKGKFDQQDRGCFGIQLNVRLGGHPYHDAYANDIMGVPGDFLILPPVPVQDKAFMFYDGIVYPGSKANLPPSAQNIGALAELKTGHQALSYVRNGNPRPDRPKILIDKENRPQNTGRTQDGDLKIYNNVINEVIREALVAKLCGKEYFLAFNRKEVADDAKFLLNSDPRIIAAGISNLNVIHKPAGNYNV